MHTSASLSSTGGCVQYPCTCITKAGHHEASAPHTVDIFRWRRLGENSNNNKINGGTFLHETTNRVHTRVFLGNVWIVINRKLCKDVAGKLTGLSSESITIRDSDTNWPDLTLSTMSWRFLEMHTNRRWQHPSWLHPVHAAVGRFFQHLTTTGTSSPRMESH